MSISSLILNNPSGFLDSCVSMMAFKTLESFFKFVIGPSVKMANNFTALSHACGAAGLTFSYLYLFPNNSSLYYVFSKFSTGYFLYDLTHCAKHINGKLKYIYFYHHLATMLYIHNNPSIYRCAEGILWGELSNISSYLVYYMLKTNNPNLKLMKKIQFIIYAFIRIPIFGYYTYLSYITAKNKFPVYTILPLYIMGLIWSKTLWKKL